MCSQEIHQSGTNLMRTPFFVNGIFANVVWQNRFHRCCLPAFMVVTYAEEKRKKKSTFIRLRFANDVWNETYGSRHIWGEKKKIACRVRINSFTTISCQTGVEWNEENEIFNRNDKTIDYLEIGFLRFDLIGFHSTISGHSESFLHRFSFFEIHMLSNTMPPSTCNISHLNWIGTKWFVVWPLLQLRANIPFYTPDKSNLIFYL